MGKLSELIQFRKPKQLELTEYLAKLQSKGLHPDGTPILDPTPMAPPIGYKKHPSMVEIVRDAVRSERLRQEALAAGKETFEEAEDFDVGDDPDQLRSPHEFQDPELRDLLAAGADAKRVREAEEAKASKASRARKSASGAPPPAGEAGQGEGDQGGAGGPPPADDE